MHHKTIGEELAAIRATEVRRETAHLLGYFGLCVATVVALLAWL